MKDRILQYLDDFAQGRENELKEELQAELKLDDATFQHYSQATQSAILHQYSQFSISTIDAFFQKVIRSFTRESGLIGDYRLEAEHDAVLEEVIDSLIDELGTNKELTDWVVEFAKENLENERAWDVRFSLIEFANEIFREEFKSIEDEVNRTTVQPGFFKELKNQLWAVKNSFLAQISKPAQEALSIIQSRGWSPEDFSYGKNSGLLTFLVAVSEEKVISQLKSPSGLGRVRSHFTQAANWPNKKSPHYKDIYQTAEQTLAPLLNEIIQIYDNAFAKALSAEVVLKNLYVFGLIADIARKLKEFKAENNVMLLADAPKFLNGVIQNSDTPFIYEKVGSFYRNYLIDEFQDTSGMQWKNFEPLVLNSLDQGYSGLVVGDVKQAIYRWRGGDLNLLQQNIVDAIGEHRVEMKRLDKNFRSAYHVVHFNNTLFSTAAKLLSNFTGASIPLLAYEDIAQGIFKKEDGYVNVRFINEEKQGESDNEEGADQPVRWNVQALEQLPRILETLQLGGVALKDIAILVRKNDEGQRIASYLLQYKNSEEARPDCLYDVVSNESLRIDGASAVNLLLAAMRYLLNTDDSIARAQLAYEFARMADPDRDLPLVFSVTNQAIFENSLPGDFTSQKAFLKKLTLIELAETLIDIFKLGQRQGELVYLQAFQDLVLDFYTRERNDLAAFLEWWEDNRHKKSVQISGDVNAVQILTIHKSKGLQFKYVIIPFCGWNLDHDNWQSPNLWVKCNEKPFAEAGYLPVKYSKVLEETYFREDYSDERTRSYLDNLNLLYVAFTRAEKGLIVMAPHPEIRGAKSTVAGVLHDSIVSSDELKSKLNEDSVLQLGVIEAESVSTQSSDNYLSLPEYIATSWREKLVIKQSGATFFEETESEQRLKINYGIHMHAVLSRMKYADELSAMLDQLILEGMITGHDKAPLENQLRDLLAIPEVDSWFSRQWNVRTEVPVLMPGKGESRLDRLIYMEKNAIVIDFKTGEPKRDDNRQVLEYMSTLRQMNFINVEGYLLYLRSKDVVQVKEGGRQKVTKSTKNKDQLTFGF